MVGEVFEVLALARMMYSLSGGRLCADKAKSRNYAHFLGRNNYTAKIKGFWQLRIYLRHNYGLSPQIQKYAREELNLNVHKI